MFFPLKLLPTDIFFFSWWITKLSWMVEFKFGKGDLPFQLVWSCWQAVIRVRFPDNHTVEATFDPSETIQSLIDLVAKVIAQPEQPFYICKHVGILHMIKFLHNPAYDLGPLFCIDWSFMLKLSQNIYCQLGIVQESYHNKRFFAQ